MVTLARSRVFPFYSRSFAKRLPKLDWRCASPKPGGSTPPGLRVTVMPPTTTILRVFGILTVGKQIFYETKWVNVDITIFTC
jgi:hypothetical protein